MPGHRKAGFSVAQVRSNNFARHGPTQMAKTLLKFGKTVPDELQATIKAWKAARISLMKRTNGSAVTTPEQYDTEYLTPVSIGTPAQTLNLDFDSGSSDLWVFSSETASSDVSGQSIYTPSDSSTSKELSGQSWDISYGDGSTSSGTVYTDLVTVGGVSFDSQAVETAETVSSSFTSDANNDGLLGLAFSTLNTVTPTAQKTFFDNIKDTLDQSLWTCDLKAGEPGTYNFGWIDESLYTGDIAYTDVDTSDGFWISSSSSSSKASGSSSSSASTTLSGIADTGTTLALFPESVCEEYYASVSGASYSNSIGGYVFSCDADLPEFSYTVGDVTVTIPSDYLNYSPVNTAGTQCYGGIQPNTDIGFSIFGDVALKAAFVVFKDDGSAPQLGFAQKDL
ncbi:aspartic peptidase domain-containing protein [Truncatella angustata]|uniref:Aspartic peptidase domain-containing protein n=1 Tax=Truncatella angustata TaxID=152316 RepID=A0A9P8UF41_9PEZI|nr:aspartic peptidase domain-containing protein [Truncatella angustata]KAH6648811.1 aspartic peptidase domain-containing protein [Truncatella angustata]